MRSLIIPLTVLVACGETKSTITVNNDAPELSILAPVTGVTVEEYDVVEFRALTTDFEDPEESLIVMWSSSLDGLLDSTPPDSSGNLYFATNSLQPGSHLITLTVSDTQGLSNNSSVEVIVTDQEDAPTIEVRAPLENSVEEGIDTEFEVYVNDIQDAAETLVVTFTSDLDGEFCTPTPDTIGIASCMTALSEGMHQLTFSVLDSHGNQGQTMQLLSVLSSSDVDNDGDGKLEDKHTTQGAATSNKLAKQCLRCDSIATGSDVHQGRPEGVKECPEIAGVHVGCVDALRVVHLPNRAVVVSCVSIILCCVEEAGEGKNGDHQDYLNQA